MDRSGARTVLGLDAGEFDGTLRSPEDHEPARAAGEVVERSDGAAAEGHATASGLLLPGIDEEDDVGRQAAHLVRPGPDDPGERADGPVVDPDGRRLALRLERRCQPVVVVTVGTAPTDDAVAVADEQRAALGRDEGDVPGLESDHDAYLR